MESLTAEVVVAGAVTHGVIADVLVALSGAVTHGVTDC